MSANPAGPLRAVLASRAFLAPGIVDLVFSMKTPERIAFRPGQFVSFDAGRDRAGLPHRRSYSIASPRVADDHLRFIIRVIPDGAASTYLLDLPIGSEVAMTGPHGFFVLEPAHAGDSLFGTTGTGIAAVMPMLAEMAERRAVPGERRLVFWGARQESDLFARPEIEALCRAAGAELRVHLSAPDATWTGARGRITQPILDELPHLTRPIFYLVGNGAMIAELKRELIARGVDRKKQVRTEAFFD